MLLIPGRGRGEGRGGFDGGRGRGGGSRGGGGGGGSSGGKDISVFSLLRLLNLGTFQMDKFLPFCCENF